MKRSFRMMPGQGGSMALFWRLFATYFLLILVPVILASTFTYFFVVRLIENDAEKVNSTMMRTFSDQTDASFLSLKSEMIQMLQTSNLRSLLLTTDTSLDNQYRLELIHSLMDQLNKIKARPYVSNAYLFFTNRDMVIDGNTYTDQAYYLTHYDPIAERDKKAYLDNFTGKKMMLLLDAPSALQTQKAEGEGASKGDLAALMSYPFNNVAPDVYLVVKVDRSKLRGQIAVAENWVTETAILDGEGRIISQTGTTSASILSQRNASEQNKDEFLTLPGGKHAISYRESVFDSSWSYVSLIDLQTLMQPARLLRTLSVAFLLIFFAIGSVVSYSLSRRLYTPIADIRSGLASHRRTDETWWRSGNDFDVIKKVSSQIISENLDLARKITGMTPMVQEHLLSRMLLGQYSERQTDEADIQGEGGAAILSARRTRTVLCVELQERFPGNDEGCLSATMTGLRANLAHLIPSEVWMCQVHPGLLACVVEHAPDYPFGPHEAADNIREFLEKTGNRLKAAIGIGKPVTVPYGLQESYEHAKAMLRYKTLQPSVDICKEENEEEDRSAWDCFLSVAEVNRIMLLYKARDYDALLAFVEELLEKGRRSKASAYQINYLCSDILHAWIRSVETEKNGYSIPFYAGLFDRMNRCVTWEELSAYFRDIHQLLFHVDQRQDRHSQFAEILAYIGEHCGEELSIELFAQRMNMSVGHFSRTFKEEVGEKYVDYVARVRLAKAKHLLLETDMKIDDIAESIGYWGRNSFIRLFRKHEGVTPAKYRALHQT